MNLKQLRERRKLSIEAVAAATKKSYSTVRNWEMGTTTPTLTPAEFITVLDLYDCTLDDFADAVKESKKVD